ncbi:hypothetical protein Sjap_014433 [Stephania japonica]|uniref:DUF1308 domain-containing protein n=1 Tax=Stephania japonica TaxID=461633 RepID=A0AAP0IIP1_9MAGN
MTTRRSGQPLTKSISICTQFHREMECRISAHILGQPGHSKIETMNSSTCTVSRIPTSRDHLSASVTRTVILRPLSLTLASLARVERLVPNVWFVVQQILHSAPDAHDSPICSFFSSCPADSDYLIGLDQSRYLQILQHKSLQTIGIVGVSVVCTMSVRNGGVVGVDANPHNRFPSYVRKGTQTHPPKTRCHTVTKVDNLVFMIKVERELWFFNRSSLFYIFSPQSLKREVGWRDEVYLKPCLLERDNPSPFQSFLNFKISLMLEQARADNAARSASTLKPASLILFFSNGLHHAVSSNLQLLFGASPFEFGGPKACAFQIKVAHGVLPLRLHHHHHHQLPLFATDFCSLISTMPLASLHVGGDLINFDTTALIALVSGITNGCAHNLIAAPETQLRPRFKCNYDFVIAQAMSELQNPMFEELSSVICHKIGIVCQSVVHEFKELVAMCAGPNERSRADQLLKKLMVVPDNPSARMSGLPTTRKIAMKNKVVFGTGDCWSAPTLTANAGFVRAIAQTGMSLLTIQHRPRALTGD